MEFLIITSTEDKASMNIRSKLLNSKLFKFSKVNFNWKSNAVFKFGKFLEDNVKNDYLIENKIFLGLTDERMIFLDNLSLNESEINPDLLIIASRHVSQTARPALLIHTTGNWSSDSSFGGKSRALSKTSALLHKSGFISLFEEANNQNLLNFAVDIEVTHHGPTQLEKPLVFIELGSSKKEWNNDRAGKIVTNAIINTIFKYLHFQNSTEQLIGLGFGGTHYAPNFNRLIKDKNIALSFICPKYYIQELNKDLISIMIQNTLERIDFFIIDWKGTNSEDKNHLIPLLEEFNIPIKKTREFN